MHWDDLRYFLALAREGTLTRAAQTLNVSHSTVARRVEALSVEAGVKLFTRTPEGYLLTVAGQELKEAAARVEEEVSAASRVLSSRDGRMSGRLFVTTIDVIADLYGHHLAQFRRRYPDIELVLSVDNSTVNLNRREADVALRMTNNPPGHLVGRRVAAFNWAPFASTMLLDECGYNGDLSALPWLAWTERAGANMIESWLNEHTLSAPVARVDAAMTMQTLVLAGVGATLLPIYMAKRSDLVQLGDPIDGFSVDLWLLTHPDLRHIGRVKAFMDHMTHAIRDNEAQNTS
ncbi:MAG: LysR family transcriptional regulator [Myxococcota bacterium]